eukprot:Awhi_evm4s14288
MPKKGKTSTPSFVPGQRRKTKRTTNKYDSNTVLQAIADLNAGLFKTQNEAAKSIDVPITTFQAYVHDPSKITKTGGPKCVLSVEQEKGLAEAICCLHASFKQRR